MELIWELPRLYRGAKEKQFVARRRSA